MTGPGLNCRIVQWSRRIIIKSVRLDALTFQFNESVPGGESVAPIRTRLELDDEKGAGADQLLVGLYAAEHVHNGRLVRRLSIVHNQFVQMVDATASKCM